VDEVGEVLDQTFGQLPAVVLLLLGLLLEHSQHLNCEPILDRFAPKFV